MKSHDPELLLPVGNMEMCLAAIHNGADAIYVGMPGFNARGRSKDHELEELKEMIETCHLYGVKVNLAFNIVIFEDELSEVIDLLEKVLPLRPDALIIQDIGLAKLVKTMAPYQVIHASTQMTVTNHDAMKFLSKLDFKRFVLGRENSLEEIEIIAQSVDYELEVFVHGALCVAYSGQCFTSESIGGRSANRGQCAQSCRLTYDLLVDGKKKNLIDRDYLVSPKDLCGIAEIPYLLKNKVKSFKVEGRLKGPEYVAATGRVYKPILLKNSVTKNEIENGKRLLAGTYSRGFFSGWLHGVNHQELVEGTYNEHRGLELGVVEKVSPKSVTVKLNTSEILKNGDGVLFHFISENKRRELGSRIFKAYKKAEGLFELEFSRDFKFDQKILGARVFKNSDPEIEKELNLALTNKDLKKRIPITAKLVLKDNERVELTFSDGRFLVSAQSENCLQFASKEFGTFEENVKNYKDEIMSLSGTVFKLELNDLTLENQTTKSFWIHQKEIKNLRRELTEKLTLLRVGHTIDGFEKDSECKNVNAVKNELLVFNKNLDHRNNYGTKLNILLREKNQVLDLIQMLKTNKLSETCFAAIKFVILDFEYGKDYSECLLLLRSSGFKVGVATTRILKPKEYHHLKVLHRLNPDVILVRNLGAFQYLKHTLNFANPLIGDFSLNVTNHLSANFLLAEGFDSLTLSYDLTGERLTTLLNLVDASKMEVTMHQYMPSFHMEHCVFAAFLSNGKSYKDCGKPCEKHRVELIDQFGNHHHIRADQECRNTMYNAVSQSAAGFYKNWAELGLGSVRFEAMYERGDELFDKIAGLTSLINEKVQAEELIKKLNLIERYGLSSDSFTRDKAHQNRKKIFTRQFRTRSTSC